MNATWSSALILRSFGLQSEGGGESELLRGLKRPRLQHRYHPAPTAPESQMNFRLRAQHPGAAHPALGLAADPVTSRPSLQPTQAAGGSIDRGHRCDCLNAR